MTPIILKVTKSQLEVLLDAMQYTVVNLTTRESKVAASILEEIYARLSKQLISGQNKSQKKVKLKYHEAHVLEQLLQRLVPISSNPYNQNSLRLTLEMINQKLA